MRELQIQEINEVSGGWYVPLGAKLVLTSIAVVAASYEAGERVGEFIANVTSD